MHEYYIKNKDRLNVKAREYRTKNRDQRHARAREYNLELRSQFLKLYGNDCACCHEQEQKFLTVGHKRNDGHADRFENGGSVGTLIRAIKYPDFARYEIQCFNCNMGAERNGGVCPHKLKKIR